jgi:transposase
MKKKNIVNLTKKEREELKSLVTKGKTSARTINHARIILMADESEPGKIKKDPEIAESLGVSISQVERIRRVFISQGLKAAIHRHELSRTKPRKFDGEDEARLITLACGEAPEGYGRWTLRLLADKAVELEIVDNTSHESVRQLLKKRNETLAKKDVLHSCK